ncbi:MAG TPA: rod shape-determining protein [Candidatus Avidehalobacter gallistercoris]|uniref:Cell shape-determining protein MreB n=1 Tax=Candidatus Avidehalobacter gallistercoris TaxID=2840694 RepID=A0A9D1KZ13_9FIRM|nr:rod shape-determining protein [Candidatus Avidehalobacter gallistercoris]
MGFFKKLFFDFGTNIGVDLGTANILIYVKNKGIVLNEPSVVALSEQTNEVIAIGSAAKRMLGRTPEGIVAVRPLREGVIADYDVTEQMLKFFIEQACGKNWILKPRIMVCIPSGVTAVEERAVKQAAQHAGAREAFLIEEPMAAAIGAGMDVYSASGNLVCDIGGGTTDVAVISLGGIVTKNSLRVGGDKLDESIVRYIRRERSLLIGEPCAEEIKIKIGTAYLNEHNRDNYVTVRGRDLVTGLPKSIKFSAVECHEAIQEVLDMIVAAIRKVLEETPPELAGDIVDRGMVLTGGGSMLDGLPRLVAESTGLHVYLAEDPVACVAIGTGKSLSVIDHYVEGASLPARRAL